MNNKNAQTDGSKLRAFDQAEQVLSKWASLKGHDKCWHHPETLQELCKIFGIPTDNDPCLPSREEFEQGCKRYQDKVYSVTNNSSKEELIKYALSTDEGIKEFVEGLRPSLGDEKADLLEFLMKQTRSYDKYLDSMYPGWKNNRE